MLSFKGAYLNFALSAISFCDSVSNTFSQKNYREVAVAIDFGPIQIDDRVVLRQLKQDLKDDWFPDPRRFDDMFDGELIQKLMAENFGRNHGAYLPEKRTVLNVPKMNFTMRHGMETSIADRALYQALASFLVPFYDPLIPWSVFNHRQSVGDAAKKALFRRAIPAWQDFVGVVKVAIKDKPVLLSTDLTNYFDNIDVAALKSQMMDLLPEIEASAMQKGLIRNNLEILFACLKEWCYSERSGLPQNRDASSFLANIYMLKVDREMLGAGYQYFRYMDDIKIACDDVFQARYALKKLGLSLRGLGLAINSGKTHICKADDSDLIQKCLDSGGSELRQIDAIWRTRSIRPISRSFPTLQALTLKLLRNGAVDSREFRYCVKRLEILATAKEFAVPNAYFEPITPSVIDALPQFPAVTDQLSKYLRSVPVSDLQLNLISELLRDPRRNFYTWQNYQLWELLVHKKYRNDDLLSYALEIVGGGEDTATRCGATIYLGALGENPERIAVAKNFRSLKSFLGQRSALLAVHELHYRPHIEIEVQPFLRQDLMGVFKGLGREGKYVSAPEPQSITSVLDVERDYE